VQIALSIWHEGKPRNISLEIPDRIKIENLWEQAQRELGMSLAIGSSWQIWQGSQLAQPPYKEGEEYGVVPQEMPREPVVPQLSKRDIEFISEVRKLGQMVTVKPLVNGVECVRKVPPESTISQLLRTHVAVSLLPADTVFNWGTIRGRGKPGALEEGDRIRFGIASAVKTKCYVYKGRGEFTNALEVGLNVRLEAEFIDIANQAFPGLGREVQYYRGMEELPVLTAVPDLLVFPKKIKRPEGDSPVQTAASLKSRRTAGPLRKIKWVVVDRAWNAQSKFQDAVVPEDIALIQFLKFLGVIPKGVCHDSVIKRIRW
jgi:hypothetical protein